MQPIDLFCRRFVTLTMPRTKADYDKRPHGHYIGYDEGSAHISFSRILEVK